MGAWRCGVVIALAGVLLSTPAIGQPTPITEPLDRLLSVLKAAAPGVVDVFVPVWGDPTSVQVFPANQQANAQAAINSFDWSPAARLTWENQQARVAAKALYDQLDRYGRAIKCVALTAMDENNLLRAAAVHPITSITRATTTATATTPAAHGLTTGDQVGIHGADVVAYNGLKTITVTSGTAFTFTVTGSPATPAAGSLFYAMGAIPPMPQRTPAQVQTAINNCIDGN